MYNNNSLIWNALGNITEFDKGSFLDFEYRLIASRGSHLTAIVELPRHTKLQIVARGDKSRLLDSLSASKLVTVSLESEFPEYFRMYCLPNQELELTQLFDPVDMEYFIDFCRAYDFELIDNAIYLSQSNEARDNDDKTGLLDDMKRFIRHNQKVLAKI